MKSLHCEHFHFTVDTIGVYCYIMQVGMTIKEKPTNWSMMKNLVAMIILTILIIMTTQEQIKLFFCVQHCLPGLSSS